MIAPAHADPRPTDIDSLHQTFLVLLPRIERRARCSFRHVNCPSSRDDCVAEAVALTWAWFVRLVRRGKQAALFAAPLARFACLQVRAGRTLGRRKRADGLQLRAEAGHQCGGPQEAGTSVKGAVEDALRENTRSPVPIQAAFRLDFPRWLGRLGARDRSVALALMAGEKVTAVARAHRISQGRISQLRRRFTDDWQAFHSSAPTPAAAAGA